MPYTVGLAYHAAGTLHLVKGDWAKAHARDRAPDRGAPDGEHRRRAAGRARVLRPGPGVSRRRRASALSRLRESEQLLEEQPARGSVRARLGLLFAGSRLSAARSARRGATPGRPRDRIRFGSHRLRGPTLSTCSATSRPIPTGSTPSAARPTIARRWRSPSRAACVRSSRTATSASARSLRTWASAGRRGEHLDTAATMYRDMDMRFWLEQAEAERRSIGPLISGQPHQPIA